MIRSVQVGRAAHPRAELGDSASSEGGGEPAKGEGFIVTIVSEAEQALEGCDGP